MVAGEGARHGRRPARRVCLPPPGARPRAFARLPPSSLRPTTCFPCCRDRVSSPGWPCASAEAHLTLLPCWRAEGYGPTTWMDCPGVLAACATDVGNTAPTLPRRPLWKARSRCALGGDADPDSTLLKSNVRVSLRHRKVRASLRPVRLLPPVEPPAPSRSGFVQRVVFDSRASPPVVALGGALGQTPICWLARM